MSVLRCLLLGALRLIGMSMMSLWSVVWRLLRSVRLAVDEGREVSDLFHNDGEFFVYSVCGWGVTSDCTGVVWLDEGLD